MNDGDGSTSDGTARDKPSTKSVAGESRADPSSLMLNFFLNFSVES